MSLPVIQQGMSMAGVRTLMRPPGSPLPVARDMTTRLPKILLKDTLGRELDTDTSYQRSINAARQLLAENPSEQPQIVQEWRLPKAPVPARPDYTRHASDHGHKTRRTEATEGGEGGEDGKAETTKSFISDMHIGSQKFNTEAGFPSYLGTILDIYTSQFAPSLKSTEYAQLLHIQTQSLLSFPEWEFSIFDPNRVYLPFCGSAQLHSRHEMQMIYKDDHHHRFPGSGGGRKSGLCYGCEKGAGPHYHEDKRARTGGGFTYFRRDRRTGTEQKVPKYWRPTENEPKPNAHIFYSDGERTQSPLTISRAPGDNVSEMTADHYKPHWMSRSEREETSGYETLREDEDSASYLASGPKTSAKSYKSPTICGTEVSPSSSTFQQKHEKMAEPEVEERGYSSLASVNAMEKAKERLKERARADKKNSDAAIIKDQVKTGDGASPQRRKKKHGQKDAWGRYRAGRDDSSSSGVSESESEWETDIEDEKKKTKFENPYGLKRRRRKNLYKPPKFFKVKRTSRKTTVAMDPFSKDRSFEMVKTETFAPVRSDRKPTVAKDPFSSDRKFNLPSQKAFELKKKERESTKAVGFNFDRSKTLYKEPKKFELKEKTKTSTDFWEAPERKKDNLASLDTPKLKEPPPRSMLKPFKPPPRPEPQPKTKPERKAPEPKVTQKPELQRKKTPPPPPPKPKIEHDKTPTVKPPPKKTVVKKERKPQPVKVKSKSPSLEPESESESELLYSEQSDSPPSTTPEPVKVKKATLPTLPPVNVPEPNLIEKAPRERRETVKHVIEAAPEEEETKKRPPPPIVKRRKAPPVMKRRKVPAAKPASPKGIELLDPTTLDYLAKYCIIHPDRLPLYERIFREVVANQKFKYSDIPATKPGHDDDDEDNDDDDDDADSTEENTRKNGGQNGLLPHEYNMIRDLTLISRSATYIEPGGSITDGHMQKLIYTLECMNEKYQDMQKRMERLELTRTMTLAGLIREKYPDLAKPDYEPKGKKKKGKKEKKKSAKVFVTETDRSRETTSMSSGSNVFKGHQLTDQDIINRLDHNKTEQLSSIPSISKLDLEIERCQEKLGSIDERMDELESERRLLALYTREQYIQEQAKSMDPDFRRKQSALFQKLNPNMDLEMNLEEVESALKQINNNLLTEKECQFIYHILDLPGQPRINMKLFSVIASLSERIMDSDPIIRKLINKFNFDALDVKMAKCKELFYLLSDQDIDAPDGKITARSLAVELAAGGVSPEHTKYVLSKFNRERKGVVDFLDYLTYVPLFIEIHDRIISDPLSESRLF
ncbi:uncharacterized protein LOC135502839 isoform X2 [Lineus longissimus]|uniref:uncharacterized protein LOC135502839 isoform X2 n=1 Tax=Lineus longissimus TaxID=88925 RepID=UPI00315DADDA